ncbi:hypothetical protein Patl1_11206 [Pistacia atlantica]|uniref:Uncharacterized protein n=1 Tax=Pistacia atlantica TaxID=434234 RepID=A0ACC1A7H3_9ROSI|nr:hypothetical protein Patl1_11206 [Pistacia atlantica]
MASTQATGSSSSMTFDVLKFDENIGFGLWQVQMMDLFVQQGLDFVLEGRPKDVEKDEWSWDNHLVEVDNIMLDLKNIGVNLEEEDQSFILLDEIMSKVLDGDTQKEGFVVRRMSENRKKSRKGRSRSKSKGKKEAECYWRYKKEHYKVDRMEFKAHIKRQKVSFPVSPNETLFSSYQRIDGGIVLTGNDNPCNVVGI